MPMFSEAVLTQLVNLGATVSMLFQTRYEYNDAVRTIVLSTPMGYIQSFLLS
jgi:hypothetical protein